MDVSASGASLLLFAWIHYWQRVCTCRMICAVLCCIQLYCCSYIHCTHRDQIECSVHAFFEQIKWIKETSSWAIKHFNSLLFIHKTETFDSYCITVCSVLALFSFLLLASPLLLSLSFCLFIIGSITLHYASWTYIIVVTTQTRRTKHWIICASFLRCHKTNSISLALFPSISIQVCVCVCVWYCYCFSLSSTYSFASLFRSLNCRTVKTVIKPTPIAKRL